MDPKLRIVTSLPLRALWDHSGPVEAQLVQHARPEQLRELVAADVPTFVVASVGAPLSWVPAAEAFAFWKRDVRSRIANPDGFHLDDFPDSRAYVASIWKRPDGRVIILLEEHH
jgi:hypothetical protein